MRVISTHRRGTPSNTPSIMASTDGGASLSLLSSILYIAYSRLAGAPHCAMLVPNLSTCPGISTPKPFIEFWTLVVESPCASDDDGSSVLLSSANGSRARS